MNDQNLLLAFLAAGKDTPKRKRTRAAMLGSLTAEPIAAVLAGRGEREAAKLEDTKAKLEATEKAAQLVVDKASELVSSLNSVLEGGDKTEAKLQSINQQLAAYRAVPVVALEELSTEELDRQFKIAQVKSLLKGDAVPPPAAGAPPG